MFSFFCLHLLLHLFVPHVAVVADFTVDLAQVVVKHEVVFLLIVECDLKFVVGNFAVAFPQAVVEHEDVVFHVVERDIKVVVAESSCKG